MKKIFVSYSRADKDYAYRLADDLTAHGFSVWIDKRIEHGSDWFDEIQQAIYHADAVVVVMSPEAENSDWCRKEILLAMREKKALYPVLLRGKEFAILIDLQFADVRNGHLPQESYYEHMSRQLGTPLKKPFDPLRGLRESLGSLTKSTRGCFLVAVGLAIGAICVIVALVAVISNIDNQLSDPFVPVNTNNNNVNVPVGNPAQNAADFAAAVLSGNTTLADQYTCDSLRGTLAFAVVADYANAGVTGLLSQTVCNVTGTNLVTCQMTVAFLTGTSANVQQTYTMQNNLVCGVVNTQVF
ncbi:MAG: toll/interleukin-1 receptor domain-containing protein [Anaerolineae bacterium]